MKKQEKKDEATEYLLCGMYKNVKIGCENIVSLMPKVTDPFLKRELTQGFEGYSDCAAHLEDMMRERGLEPEEPGMISKIGAKAGIILSMALSPGSRSAARRYIIDTREGARRLDRMCEEVMGLCDARVLGYCNSLIEKERQSAAKMEAFL